MSSAALHTNCSGNTKLKFIYWLPFSILVIFAAYWTENQCKNLLLFTSFNDNEKFVVTVTEVVLLTLTLHRHDITWMQNINRTEVQVHCVPYARQPWCGVCPSLLVQSTMTWCLSKFVSPGTNSADRHNLVVYKDKLNCELLYVFHWLIQVI